MVNVKLRLVATKGYIVNAKHINHDQAKQSNRLCPCFCFWKFSSKGRLGDRNLRRPRTKRRRQLLAKIFLFRVPTRTRDRVHGETVVGGGLRAMIHMAGRSHLRRSKDIEEAGGRSDAGRRETSGTRKAPREAILSILWRGGRLTDGPRNTCLGQISRQLVHFLLLSFVLQVQELHIFFEPTPLLTHVFDVLTLLLELIQNSQHMITKATSVGLTSWDL